MFIKLEKGIPLKTLNEVSEKRHDELWDDKKNITENRVGWKCRNHKSQLKLDQVKALVVVMMMMMITNSTMVIDTRTQINLYFTRSKLLNNDLNHLKTNTLGISFETHRPLEIRVDDGRISSKIEFWGKGGWN